MWVSASSSAFLYASTSQQSIRGRTDKIIAYVSVVTRSVICVFKEQPPAYQQHPPNYQQPQHGLPPNVNPQQYQPHQQVPVQNVDQYGNVIHQQQVRTRTFWSPREEFNVFIAFSLRFSSTRKVAIISSRHQQRIISKLPRVAIISRPSREAITTNTMASNKCCIQETCRMRKRMSIGL